MSVIRNFYDWEAIESDYRVGTLSIREVAKKHGCSDTAIRKRAKAEGWDRDLTKKVADKVRSELVRSEVRTGTENERITEREIIEVAAATQVQVVREHRKDIQKLRDLEQKLLDELDNNPVKVYATQYQGAIVEKEYALTVPEKSTALNALSSAAQRRIQLERQAFNIADTPDGKDNINDTLQGKLQEIAEAIDGKTCGLPAQQEE